MKVKPFSTPSILDIMAVVKATNNGPSPGLDHIWQTKGHEAIRLHLFNYWTDARKLESEKNEADAETSEVVKKDLIDEGKERSDAV